MTRVHNIFRRVMKSKERPMPFGYISKSKHCKSLTESPMQAALKIFRSVGGTQSWTRHFEFQVPLRYLTGMYLGM